MLEWFFHVLGYGICHQLPERSFFAGATQFPVCARDTGIYLGFLVAITLLLWWGRRNRPSGMPSPSVWVLLAILFATMVFDGVTSYAGLRETTNTLRLATGLCAGFAMAALVAPILNDVLFENPSSDRVLSTRTEVLYFLGALVATFAIAQWVLPYLGVGYALLSGLSIVATFAAVNLGLVCMFPRFERTIVTPRNLVSPLTIALALTVLELALVSALKAAVL